jgi:GntR family transcriptional repressor for pyruvate dehydrogenase complex
MTERELAKALNVSRNSVREAINKLVTLRFLEQRQGQGTFVRSMEEVVKIPLATVMETQDASLIDLMEMRMGIESNAASLAAQPGQPVRIWRPLKRPSGRWMPIPVPVDWAPKGTSPFTWPLPWATKNPLQVYIMKNVSEFLHVGIRENLLHLYQNPDNIVEILRQHQAIYQAIRSGDAEAAYTDHETITSTT